MQPLTQQRAIGAVHLEARAELSSQRSAEVLPADDGHDGMRRISTPTTSRRSLGGKAPQRQVSLAALLASWRSLAGAGTAPNAGGAFGAE